MINRLAYTLMKLAFFKRSIELVEKYRRPGQHVQHTFQTNGILIDDDWCSFFKEHDFLVGPSVDGPRELHDTYRVDRRGRCTFNLVMRRWQNLRRHGVDFNILCTVNAANEKHGRGVCRFFRDELDTKWTCDCFEPSGFRGSVMVSRPATLRCGAQCSFGANAEKGNEWHV